jgi:hypothetical protein
MGDHYVPQYYLKGFSGADGKTIWVYDKSNGCKFATQVKSIANETGFYSPEVESHLASHVEEPANAVLKKIRNRVQISTEDKQVLSAYMVCMWTRVPRGKERVKELAPSVAEKVREEIDRRLSSALLEKPEKTAFIEGRRAEAHTIIDRYASDPPKDVWLRNIPPERRPGPLAALSRMTWRFFTFDQYPAFLTSDNPVFYFTNMGVGKPESEVTFPISSHIALWATRRSDLAEGYFPTNPQVVRELNRRTASFSTRYVFHSTDEKWVLRLLTQHSWRLNMLK